MKTYLVLCGAAALLTLSAAARPAGATPPPTPAAAVSPALTPDEQLFTSLWEQVSTAISKGDMTTLGKFMAPEYVHYNPNGGSGGRTEELAELSTWGQTTMKGVGPVKVSRYGDMAITVSTTTYSGIYEGKPFSRNVQTMAAWVLRNGQWQMTVLQSKDSKS